jgi:hypothetical protein
MALLFLSFAYASTSGPQRLSWPRIREPRSSRRVARLLSAGGFIHVDKEALQEIVTWGPGLGYVNFVDSLWEPMGDRYFEDGYEPEEDEILEPVDGCAEENVGWMRVSVRMAFGAYFYLGAGDSEHWYLFYRRPPHEMLY